MLIHLFPGQGSQFKGMGAQVFSELPEYVEQASNILGYDLAELCLEDPFNQLGQTQYTQPALYVVCALHFLALKETPSFVLGHSLGLYPALFAANVFDFEQGLRIVMKRAELMAAISHGAMMAIIGKNANQLGDVLSQHAFYDIDIANYNSPTQIVVSGKKNRIEALKKVLSEMDYRTVILPVSGAFHSRYMKHAASLFYDFLKNLSFAPLKIPVLSTTDGEYILQSHLIEELAYQLIKPVRWEHVIRFLLQKYSIHEMKEVGPGHVLTSLNQQIMAYLEELA